MGRTDSLRVSLTKRELVVAPGAYSALTAKLIEAAGFGCVYMSGYCTAASTRGLPDLGLVTMTEMLNNVRAMADAVGIPLIADGDTGYGNALNVVRTVREYEKAGAAAIHIEDQVWPKRCGHMKNKHVIPKEEMVNKVRAAVDCRASTDFIVIARTDAIAVEGLQAAIDRLAAYAAAGADVVFADGQETMEHVREVPKQLPHMPCLINLGPLTPPLSVSELQAFGYAVAIYPSVCIAPAVAAVQDALVRLKETGNLPPMEPDQLMRLWMSFNEFLNVPQYNAMEEKYKSP
jgi:2-methylisocitrate lyase-like PEP mutase family enzyme